MASVVYPGLPRPVDIAGIFNATDQGYKAGQDWRDNREGQKAFGAYLDSLRTSQGASQALAGGAPAAQPSQPDYPTQRVASAFGDASGPLNGYYSALRSAESSGNDAATNPRSSATGRYQFTKGTWDGLMTAHPELGLTPAGITDPGQQERAVRALTAQNAKALSGSGIPVNPGNLYAAHFLGAGGAGKVLSAPDNVPVSALVSPEVVQANPQLANMTVGDFKQWTAGKVGGGAPQGVQVADASGGAPQMPAQNAASILPPPEVMRALFRSKETRPLAIGLAQSAIKLRANQNDPTARIEYLTAVEKLKQLQNPDAQVPDSVRALNLRAEQAGLRPGTPEYQKFMISGGRGPLVNVNTAEEGPLIAKPPAGFAYVKDANDPSGYRAVPIPGGPADTSQTEANRAANNATKSDVITTAYEKAKDLIGRSTTGVVGQGAALYKPSDAAELRRQVKVLTANATIENLNAMRRESKTGGALGNVTEGEGKMLAAAAGAIDPDASPEQFKSALDNYYHTLLRIVNGPETGDQIFRQMQGSGDNGAPQPGQIEDGYRFKGGNPSDPNSWEPVQ